MVYDFHTHTSLSDGVLSPIELIRRAHVNGYQAVALTDHASPAEMGRIIRETADACALARTHWDILAIPGIELTHVPPPAISEAAARAKELGAWLVVIHGETIVEPVAEGTNLAALHSPHVDILAHPGLITEAEAELAAASGVFLEISTRKGHCLTNGHVASLARKAGAKLILNSDAHSEENLLTISLVDKIGHGAGLDDASCYTLSRKNPQELVERLPV